MGMDGYDTRVEHNGFNILESVLVLERAYRRVGFKVVRGSNSDGKLELYKKRYSGIWPFRKELSSVLIGSLHIYPGAGENREQWELKTESLYIDRLMGVAREYNQKFKANVRVVSRKH